jgi:hypothetical protein
MVCHLIALFEPIKESKENLDKRNNVDTSEIFWFPSKPILPQKESWAWHFKDRIGLETIIK